MTQQEFPTLAVLQGPLLEEQEQFRPRDVFRRYQAESIPGLGRITPFAQQALSRRYDPLRTQYLMGSSFINAGDNTFESFLRDRAELQQRLQPGSGFGADAGSSEAAEAIRAMNQGIFERRFTPGAARGFLQRGLSLLRRPEDDDFTDQEIAGRELFRDQQNQLAFVAQPALAGIAPALRGAYSQGLKRIFDRVRAVSPDLPFLEYASQRGFF